MAVLFSDGFGDDGKPDAYLAPLTDKSDTRTRVTGPDFSLTVQRLGSGKWEMVVTPKQGSVLTFRFDKQPEFKLDWV